MQKLRDRLTREEVMIAAPVRDHDVESMQVIPSGARDLTADEPFHIGV